MFQLLAKYSIHSRGVFLMVRNVSEKTLLRDKMPKHIEVEGETYEVLGFDFPSKIPRSYLKPNDIIGINIEPYDA